MAANVFRAKIEHTEKTIFQLYKTQYHTYEQAVMLFRLALGFALVFVAAFSSFYIWARGIILLLGAWFIVSLDFPSQIRADKVLEDRHGILPKMEYEFFDDSVRLSGEGSMNIKYKKFKKLAEDSEYLYMFISKDSVCMIDRKTIHPKTDAEFKDFICEKTGLKWQLDRNMLSLNIYDIQNIIKNRKNNR